MSPSSRLGSLRKPAVALACVTVAAAFLVSGKGVRANEPVDTGVCTLQIVEVWSPPLTTSVQINPAWHIVAPVTGSCTSDFTKSLSILSANGFADEASCASVVDVEGGFYISDDDGFWNSGPLLSVAGAGPLTTQAWVFSAAKPQEFDATAVFTMNNPQQQLAQCQAGGLQDLSMTATFWFQDNPLLF